MYKAKKSYKTLGFKRGQDPKKALDIGLRSKISSWLDEMEVKNYNINDDLTIDVSKDVYLNGKFYEKFPSFIKFGKVEGYFYCNSNNLTSLKGSPEFVKRNFNCNNNILSSLEGAPKIIEGWFFGLNNNDVQFTKEDVKKVSNVGGGIHV